ncbi:MAG TPA: hypothetical protein VGN26_03955 [Armatimonadota bacterium]|jgi:hypothetical protein
MRRLRFYWRPGTYSSQTEAWALLGLRFGTLAFGLARLPPTGRQVYRIPWWQPRLMLKVAAPIGQCSQQWLFRVIVGPLSAGWRTRGDARPDLATYYEVGLILGWSGRQRFRRLRLLGPRMAPVTD